MNCCNKNIKPNNNESHSITKVSPMIREDEFESLRKLNKENGLSRPIIDDEFRNLQRKLRDGEYKKLEESILLEGIRDPLILWNGILIDGHNRLEIANKHKINYATRNNDNLTDREEVKTWIINNQLGRRNLTPEELSYYRGKLYELRKQQGERKDLATSGKNYPKRTSEQLAELYGVSEKTIRNDAEFSKAIDKVEQEVGSDVKTAILLGKAKISKKDVGDILEIKEEAPELVEPIMQGEMTISDAKRKLNREKRIEAIRENTIEPVENAGLGKFPVIYADPPWRYEFSKSPSRDIENQYPTMSFEEICNLDIGSIANDDCVLFLWTTSPKLVEALQVINAWGFKYRTNAVWVKDKMGMGYYFRQQHELLLVATRGNLPTCEPSNRVSSVIEFPRDEHSKKPDVVYEKIEKMYPEYRKLELFARSNREGWEVWGMKV